ncbi:MAG: ATP-binding protein [Vibrio anguillarum]|nr:ATP-binding protein [Vibrio anguillarum]
MNVLLQLTRVAEITTQEIRHTESLAQSIKEAFDLPLKPAQIEIHTDAKNAFQDARTAFEFGVKLNINNTSQTLSKYTTRFDKALFLLNIANFKSEQTTATDLAKYGALALVPAKMSKTTLFEKVKAELSEEKAQALISELDSYITKMQEGIKQFHMIDESDKDVEIIEAEYTEFGDLSEKPGIYLFAGPTGSGKSSGSMLPTFESACLNRQMPLFINGSRALAQSMLPAFDERFYKYADTETGARGVLGVVYKTMLDEAFAAHREQSEVLLIDEIEDVLDLCTATIAGDGSLADLKLLNERLDAQIKKSKVVIASDAYMSMNTFNRIKKLAKESNKKIYICRPKAKATQAKVTVMTKAQNLAQTQTKLDQLQNVFAFCDASHNATKSTFNSTFRSLNARNAVQLDGAFMHTDKASELSEPNEFAGHHQLIFANTAAKNGLSITREDFKIASLLAFGTAAPNDLLQAPARPRNAMEIMLSFCNKAYKVSTNADAILAEMIRKDQGEKFSLEAFNEMMKDETLKAIAERIAFKNTARQNYAFTVITMFEQQGYKVQYLNANDEVESRGLELEELGSQAEKESRESGIINAEHISEDTAESYRSSGEMNSMQKKYELASYNLRNFYNVDAVSQDLLDFDSAGYGRNVIRNHLMSQGTVFGTSLDAKFRAQTVSKFFALVKTNSDFQFSSEHGYTVRDWVETGELQVGKHKAKVKDYFFKVFLTAKLTKNTAVMVKNILVKEFGMIVENGAKENYENKDGVRTTRATKVAIMDEQVQYWLNKVQLVNLPKAA